MKKKTSITILSLMLSAAAPAGALAAGKSTHIKSENRNFNIRVEAEVKTPSGMEGPVTSLAGDSIYFENTSTGEWASYNCVTYMSAEEMEQAYDENNGDDYIVEEKHYVGSSSDITVDGITGTKRKVNTVNPVTRKTEQSIVSILPQEAGCIVVKSSVGEDEYEDILSCIKLTH